MVVRHAGYASHAISNLAAVVCLSGLLVCSAPGAKQNQRIAPPTKLAGAHVLANLPARYPEIVTVECACLGWDFGFSGDGRFIACGFSTVIDVKGRKSLKLPLPDNARELFDYPYCRGLAISPCGEYLLAAGHLRNVYYWSIKESKFKGGLIATSHEDKLRPSTFAGHSVLRMRFARSGRYLVLRCGNGSIYVYSWPSLRWIETLQDRGGINCSVDISDDGRYVATGCAGDPALLWELDEERGASPPAKISPEGMLSHCLALSRSGSMVAYAGFGRRVPSVIETYSKQERASLRPSTSLAGPFRLAFSADGRLLVISGQHGVSVLDLARREEIIFLAAEMAYADIIPQTQDLLIIGNHKVYVVPWQLYLRKWSDIQEEPLPPDRINRLLTTLADENAKHAFDAMIQLIGQGDITVTALANHLQPVLPISNELGQQLLQKMASGDPAVREEATRQMQNYGLGALEVLKQASQQHPDPEVRRRCANLLRSLDDVGRLSLFERRSLELLESLATPAAVGLLKKLAGGIQLAPLTQEAQRVLQRLSWRPVCNQ